MMCHRDEQIALDRGLEGGNFFGYSLGHYYVFGEHRPGSTDVWTEFLERRGVQGFSPEVEAALRQERLGARLAAGDRTGLRGATGTPAQVREYLERFEQAGVDQVIFVLQAGKNRHEDICESLEVFGRVCSPPSRTATRRRSSPKRLGSPRRSRTRSSAGAGSRPPRRCQTVTPSPPCRGAGPTSPGARRCANWLEHFAEARAKGVHDESLGILGG